MTLPTRIVVIGGSAAGMGAAGAAKQYDPQAQVTVFTELSDAAYSPCGIPYVHGARDRSFDRLILLDQGPLPGAGAARSTTRRTSSALTWPSATVEVPGAGRVPFDRLVLGDRLRVRATRHPRGPIWTASTTCRDIRAGAGTWDERPRQVKRAVIAEAQPIGVEMATALAHRGIETTWSTRIRGPMAEIADPDIMAPVEESWRELGVHVHLNTAIKALPGTERVQAVADLARGVPGRHGRDRGQEAARTTSLAAAGRDQAGLDRRHHRGPAHAHLGRRASSPPATASRCPRASPGFRSRASPAATPTRRERSLAANAGRQAARLPAGVCAVGPGGR